MDLLRDRSTLQSVFNEAGCHEHALVFLGSQMQRQTFVQSSTRGKQNHLYSQTIYHQSLEIRPYQEMITLLETISSHLKIDRAPKGSSLPTTTFLGAMLVSGSVIIIVGEIILDLLGLGTAGSIRYALEHCCDDRVSILTCRWLRYEGFSGVSSACKN